MGGRGSGNLGFKKAVEDCYTFSLTALLCDGHIQEYQSTETVRLVKPWYARTWIVTIDILPAETWLSMYLRDCKQWLNLYSTPMNFGGVRWWFECPACERRCTKLHSPFISSQFKCRKCLDLTYHSCQEAGTFAGRIKPKMKRDMRKPWRRKRDRHPYVASRADRTALSNLEQHGYSPEQAEAFRHLAIQVMDELDPYVIREK